MRVGVRSVNQCVPECPASFSGCLAGSVFLFQNLDVTVTSHVVIQYLTDMNKHMNTRTNYSRAVVNADRQACNMRSII